MIAKKDSILVAHSPSVVEIGNDYETFTKEFFQFLELAFSLEIATPLQRIQEILGSTRYSGNELAFFLKKFLYPLPVLSFDPFENTPFLLPLKREDIQSYASLFPFHFKKISHALENLESHIPYIKQFSLDLNSEEIVKKLWPFAFNNYGPVYFQLQKAYVENQTLVAELFTGKTYKVIPHEIFYLDGALALIFEDVESPGLCCLYISEIKKLSVYPRKQLPKFSSIESQIFINGLMEISGPSKRLIFKVLAEKPINLIPDYVILKEHYMTTNSKGHIIWAASVQDGLSLYEWLNEISSQIEILDPESIKQNLKKYQQELLIKKVA